MSKRPTQADVARSAGVSATTVSLVLNGRTGTRISDDAARRVRAAADALGYSPDPTALSLRTGRTKTLGFVSDGVTVTRYASAMIRGVLDAAESKGQSVMMAEVDDHPDRWERAVVDLSDRKVDAIVIGLMVARKIELPPMPAGMSAVIVNGLSGGLPSVLPDEFAAGRAAAEYVIRAGHRRIAFVGRSERMLDPVVSATVGRRYQGIDRAMADAGLHFITTCDLPEWEPGPAREAAISVLESPSRPTAILAANDRVAFGVYQAAAELGLAIADDVSVMSFDDEALADYVRPGLTTMRLPYRDMGMAGVKEALNPVNDRLELPMPLVERGSVAPPRGQ